ncbi:MAG: MATE family efflux transporter, partial [Pseudomonadales bacterium]|nr:MATE family efflux transporter [Pseudomonadales bacterium]
DARISGTIMVGGAILQMVFAPILIFGLAGIPSLGITGAAIAMVGSRFVLFLVTLYLLHAREQLLDFSNMSAARVMSSWRRILVVSIPATATNLIGPVSTAIIVSMLARFGQEAVAGFGIASRIEGLFVIPLFALSASIGPYVGQNWGASLYERANQAMILSFRYSVIWGLLVAAILFVFGAGIAAQFDDNTAVTEVATWYLTIVPISYGTWGMLMMASAIFNSLGRPVSSTIMSIVRMFVIYVPAAFLGQRLFGLEGIFMAACMANLVMGTAGFVWNRRAWLPVIRQARHPEGSNPSGG